MAGKVRFKEGIAPISLRVHPKVAEFLVTNRPQSVAEQVVDTGVSVGARHVINAWLGGGYVAAKTKAPLVTALKWWASTTSGKKKAPLVRCFPRIEKPEWEKLRAFAVSEEVGSTETEGAKWLLYLVAAGALVPKKRREAA